MKFFFSPSRVTLYFVLALVPSFLHASELACPVKEMVGDEQLKWRITDASCPLGEGLWQKKPTKAQGNFFVQCAYTKKIPDLGFLQLLTQIVPSNKILLRKEPGQYRCLLGPFTAYLEAVAIMERMHKEEVLKSAFVREVTEIETNRVVEQSSQAIVVPVTPPVPTPSVEPEPEVPMSTPTMVPAFEDVDTTKAEVNKESWTRDFYQIGALYSPVPSDNESIYAEADKKWLRAPYEEAKAICSKNSMQLVSMESLKTALEDENTREQLPKRLPYWIEDKFTFDIVMMVPISLTENSAIYVLCE